MRWGSGSYPWFSMARPNQNQNRFRSFEEFWPYYVCAHTRPVCRGLHYVGTSAAVASVACAIYFANPWLLLLALVLGYGCAWVGHFTCERNLPATFDYAAYSFRADFRMLRLGLTGKMAAEVARHCPSAGENAQDAAGR